ASVPSGPACRIFKRCTAMSPAIRGPGKSATTTRQNKSTSTPKTSSAACTWHPAPGSLCRTNRPPLRRRESSSGGADRFLFYLLEDGNMRRMICWRTGLAVLSIAAYCGAVPAEKDVPWRAQAEIARRGAMVERVGGAGDANDSLAAIAAAMQPPADDSH